MRCWQGKPEVNAGRYFGRVDVDAMGCIHDPKVTHSLLTVLILILVAVMFVLLYFNRRKVQDNVKPLIDNFQRSMQYKTIEKVILILREIWFINIEFIHNASLKQKHNIFYFSRSMKILWEMVAYPLHIRQEIIRQVEVILQLSWQLNILLSKTQTHFLLKLMYRISISPTVLQWDVLLMA